MANLLRLGTRNGYSVSTATEVVGVILAAGEGVRLRPLTNELPKTLLPVAGDKSILDLAVANLAAVGVARVAIVTGFAAERIDEHAPVLRERHGIEIDLIFNDKALIWNNAYSLYMARHLYEQSTTLVVNGDTVHPVAVEEALVAARRPDDPSYGILLALDDQKQLGDEEMKVVTDDQNRVERITKLMDPAAASGEYIGVTLLEPAAGPALSAALETTFTNDPGLYYEDGYQLYVQDGGTVRTASIGAQIWVEVDNHDDLARARDIACHL